MLRRSARVPFVASVVAASALAAAACEKTETWSRRTAPDAATAGRAGGAGSGSSGSTAAGAAGGTTTPTDYGPYQTATRGDLVAATATCTLTVLEAFATSAAALDAATSARAAAPTDAAAIAKARDAYRAALEAWAEAEVFSFGPAGGGPSATAPTPGGQDLGPGIYAWPLVSRCEVEKVLAGKGWEAPTFGTSSLLTVRTLSALDFLSSYEGADQTCGGSLAGAWATLSSDELTQRRAAYGAVVAKDVAARGAQLRALWMPGSGDFAATLSSAGKGSALFPSEQSALNAISDAMFTVDLRVKDRKLGHPLGLIDCTKPLCPEGIESQWAGDGRESLRHNLLGFRRLATGCGPGGAGVGFDDLLSSIGQAAAADQLRAAVKKAVDAVDGLPQGDLQATLVADPARVAAVRDAVRELTVFMKSDFLTLLDLEPPKILEGDND